MSLLRRSARDVLPGLGTTQPHKKQIAGVQPIQSEACAYKCHRADFPCDVDLAGWDIPDGLVTSNDTESSG
jgi:hypothetical protein